ncbi:hypothetical protein [Sporosarcina sp. FA9]|uniref:hypothetical protein n=1 Tax=Sporosarcina sp. FA9 TaxID=3413030 RepID=UPI003F657152
MKFGKRYSNKTVIMAMLHGVLIGVAAVSLIALILITTSDKTPKENVKEKELETEVPTTGPAPVETEVPTLPSVGSMQLFARQHGVFTTHISATAFISEEPSLASTAIIKADGQYYVWSAVGLSEAELMNAEIVDTFRKKLIVDTSACVAIGAGKIPDILGETDATKIKISDADKTDIVSGEFNRNVDAVIKYTSDMRLIRLQLLSHYSLNKECVKISF